MYFLSITGNVFGKEGKQKQLEQARSEQTTEYAPFDESGNISPDSTWAKSDSVSPIEDVSEDFSKMNRGQDEITESQKIRSWSKD